MVAIEEEATVIANLAATEEERKESELEEPAPKKKKSKFISLLEDVCMRTRSES